MLTRLSKYGPIDFQVREPAQPIFANLNETNSCIELEVAQEYLGQQDHGMFGDSIVITRY